MENTIYLKKKLICKNNNKTNTNIELRNKIMNEMMSITNKDALKDKIHAIHNYCRNNGVGYGMNALKVFNIFFGLKKIEENNLFEKSGLIRIECKFSYLLNLANENKGEQLVEIIFGDVLNSISESNIRDLLFYEIPKNIKSSAFVYLIKEIDSITLIEKTCNVLLSGKIYEYFIGRCQDDISDLGAYFTDRHIVDYIYQKLQPTVNENGEIGSMIDMFGGSGGFTTGYIHYMKEHFNVDWENEIEKVYHYDMNEDVIKSAGLEFFCLTGVLPNMKHLQYKNSFTDEFVGEDGRTEQKYKYVITNPPYGGDKNNKTEAQIKREKIKEYIKKELLNITNEEQKKRREQQLKEIENQEKRDKNEQDKIKVSLGSSSQRIQRFAKKYNLKGTDKEACSLILMMELLEENGTCIGVLKEGVFFNKTYKELRKILIENYNVREVISVPADQFENTKTKTSIIIFDNKEEKTKEVKFSNLTIERYEEDKFEEIMGDIYITESKGDIKFLTDTLLSQASKEEILVNSICSLNGKDYNKKEIICGKDYELVKLGESCEIKLGTRITKKDNIDGGDIPVYGGGDITFYTNTCNRNENTLIISRYALSKTCVRLIPNKFYLNDSGLSIYNKNNELQKYINYYLLSEKNQEYIYNNCTSGSIQRNLNMNIFNNLQIPIPKTEEKIKEWVDKISKPYDLKNQKEQELKDLEIEIQNKIKNIIENEECDEVELGDICEIKSGKRLPTGETLLDYKTEYPYIRITDIINNSISIDKIKYISENVKQKISKYIITTDDIFITIAGTTGLVGIIPKELNNANLTENAIRLVLKNKELQYYIMYYLHYNSKNEFKTNTLSSTIPKLSIERLSKIKIKIPKNKDSINGLDPLFNKIEKLQTEIKENKNLYNQFIQELADEALPKIQLTPSS